MADGQRQKTPATALTFKLRHYQTEPRFPKSELPAAIRFRLSDVDGADRLVRRARDASRLSAEDDDGTGHRVAL